MRAKKMAVPMVEKFEVGHGTKSFVARMLASLKREGVIAGYVPTRKFLPRKRRLATGFWIVRVESNCYKARQLIFIYPERLAEFQSKNPGEAVIPVSLGDRESKLKRRIIRFLFNGTN